jgi:Ca2+-transporting ATPase
MTVQMLYAGGELFEVNGSGYTPDGEFRQKGEVVAPQSHPALLECLKAGLLCNDARLIAEGTDTWRIEGDSTEGALLVAVHKAGLHHASVCCDHPRLDTIPFESQHQFMATLHHNRTLDARHVYLKGSLESLISRCDKTFDSHMQPMPLDKALLQKQVEDMAAQGLRVLAFARADHHYDAVQHHEVMGALGFLGLQAMIDPSRPEGLYRRLLSGRD